MDDVNEDAKGGFRRVEILTGPGRRRQWSNEEKAQIAAEAIMPGAVVSQIARRWQICPQQVFAWRRAALRGTPTDLVTIGPAFVPIVEGPSVAEQATAKTAVRKGFDTLAAQVQTLVKRHAIGTPDWSASLFHADSQRKVALRQWV